MVDYYEAELRRGFNNDEQRLWLADVVNRLSDRPVWKCQEIQYWNHPELPEPMRAQGYYACLQSADRNGYPLFIMISRSHTTNKVSLAQIVDELSSQDIVFPFAKFGEYYARRSSSRGPGKYATIKFGSRWYMISVCGQPKPYYRLIRPERLKAAVRRTPTYKELEERQREARAKSGAQ